MKSGGTLLTPIGQLRIHAVDPIEARQIGQSDAEAAGFRSLQELLAELHESESEQLYRIRFALLGPDPRVKLRNSADLSVDEAADLDRRLRCLDERSATGPWTLRVLYLIQMHPERRAADLASESGYSKEWLKLNVRKLKNLGLTESLEIGYRLSPRGAAYLGHTHRSDEGGAP